MIRFIYGERQQFRWHHGDINVIGRVDGVSMPLRRSVYRLNDGPESEFYVEQTPDPGIDFSYRYKNTPARLRLIKLGDFNVEIPVDSPELREGDNTLLLEIEGENGEVEQGTVEFTWDPEPVSLPVNLTDLSRFEYIQQVGQPVDGAWEVDPNLNVIRTRGQVKPDSLLLLGSPYGPQEATYSFRYFDGSRSKYIGLSCFFVAHETEDPSLPIKPAFSTVGLATLRPRGEFAWEARIWIAAADRPGWRPDSSNEEERQSFTVVRTDPPAFFEPEPNVSYRVRHQALFEEGCNRSRFRIWREGEPEPESWLCDEDDSARGPNAPRYTYASFGLFMHSGIPNEWWNIEIDRL